MIYCLDANVFIESHKRYYSFAIAPPFWNALADWGEEQIACGVTAVYDDLMKVDDELSHWAKSEGSALFCEPDEETYACYGEIADLVADCYEPHLTEAFLDCSDPWVIAHAKSHGLAVVTLEILRPEVPRRETGRIGGKKIQVPNVCQRVGVEYMNTFRMLHNLDFRFQ